MRIGCRALIIATSLLFTPMAADAQDRGWVADLSFGWAGLVDDSTQNYVVLAGGVRRYLTSRISIGPELVIMNNSDLLRDRLLMVTGNVVFDLIPVNGAGARGFTPFVVAGGGLFTGRERFPTGSFWASDPAFTAGGGVRGKISDVASLSADYRIGWELHQRLTGSVGLHW